VSVQRGAGQQPAKRFKRTHRIGIPSSQAALADPLTAPKSGPFGNRSGYRAGEHRLRFLDTNPVHDAVKKHRQQQIGERTGSHDGCAVAQRPVVESQVGLLGRHRSFPFIQHAHVAADGECPQNKLSVLSRALMFWLPAQQGSAKTDRETEAP
jgi:hypothetical protein